MKFFLSLTHPHSQMSIRICIFNFNNNKETKQEDKENGTKKEKKNICGKSKRDMIILFANFLCLLLAYLIEHWISTGCSYEFNVVYVQREIFAYYFFILYLFIRSCKFVTIEARTSDIAHENAMSSKIIWRSSHGNYITRNIWSLQYK